MNLLNLFRWKNLLIAGVTVLLTKYAIFEPAIKNLFTESRSTLSFWETLLLAFSVMIIAAAGYVINDINDIDADEINKPGQNIVGKAISLKTANTLYIVLNVIGILLAAKVGSLAGNYKLAILHVVVAALMWIYSTYVKNSFLIGNIIVAACSGIVALTYFFFESLGYLQLYADVLISSFKSMIGGPLGLLYQYSLVLALLGFGLSLIREIIKDLQDYNGDFSVGANTLPIVLGEKGTKAVIITLALSLMIGCIFILHTKLTTPPFNELTFIIYCWLFVILPISDIILTVAKAKESKDYQRPSNTCKFVMATGILTTVIYALNV